MKLPPAMLDASDVDKRAFAALYWFGVCIGELHFLGASDDELRLAFERALSTAKKRAAELNAAKQRPTP